MRIQPSSLKEAQTGPQCLKTFAVLEAPLGMRSWSANQGGLRLKGVFYRAFTASVYQHQAKRLLERGAHRDSQTGTDVASCSSVALSFQGSPHISCLTRRKRAGQTRRGFTSSLLGCGICVLAKVCAPGLHVITDLEQHQSTPRSDENRNCPRLSVAGRAPHRLPAFRA